MSGELYLKCVGIEKRGKRFKLHSEYKPTRDQPQAIEYLSKE